MNVAYRWLQDYITTTTPPHELGERFRMTSSEAEGVSQPFTLPETVVVGHTKTAEKHPNADRLRVVTVDTGDQIRTIVCGAPNVAANQYVLVALPGTTLPGNGTPFEIQPATIRGIQSAGMICSAAELGLPIESDGIMVLEKATPGTPAVKALGLDDWVIDLEITPNRPDLLSYFGLAREVATFERGRLKEPTIASFEPDDIKRTLHLECKNEDSRLCSRFSAIALEIPANTESPWWMQSRLLLAGMRPINAVVDVTNYVMLELGQPLHAYDAALIPQSNRRNHHFLGTRSAHSGEKIDLLDGSSRSLEAGDIVITDCNDTVIGLAGIMGGASSAILNSTTTVILEAATFNPGHIRRTSRRLGLRTEASLRFEKGLDAEMTVRALKRAVYLLQHHCGAKLCGALVDHHPKAIDHRPRIHVPFNRLQELLGIHITAAECRVILTKLGFQLTAFTKSGFDTVPPTWRADIELTEDVLEELVRIWGYERIPSTMLQGSITPPQENLDFKIKGQLGRSLAASGYFGCVSQPFVSEQELQQFGLEPSASLKLPNPLSKDTAYLQPSHVIPLVKSFAGINSDYTDAKLFELGKVFAAPSLEEERLTLVVRSTRIPEDVYREVKADLLEALSTSRRLADITFSRTEEVPGYLQKDVSFTVKAGNTILGHGGQIRSDVLDRLKIRRARTMVIVELNAELLFNLPHDQRFYQPPSTVPSIERDMTLILDESISFSQVDEVLQSASKPEWFTGWQFVSSFTGKPLPETKKSVTLHLIYNAQTRSLTEDEVNTHQQQLIDLCISKLKAALTP